MQFERDPLMRPKDCADYLGICISAFWCWVQMGKIPAGIKLSNRCMVWRKSTLDAFVEGQAG
jgi:predicted DNA-binding transcriptional regulator AlpA